jgi:hypothetical protein
MPKEYYNKKILLKFDIAAITFGQRIFYSMPKKNIPQRLRYHEQEHCNQYRKDGILLFLIKYVCEYIYYRFKGFNNDEAYYHISYEKLARIAERRVM